MGVLVLGSCKAKFSLKSLIFSISFSILFIIEIFVLVYYYQTSPSLEILLLQW